MLFVGYSGAQIWMDKATVKQVRHPLPDGVKEEEQSVVALNKAGVALFPWILGSADEIWICHSETYFERIWCTYEMAAWITLRGGKGMRFVSNEFAKVQRQTMLVYFTLFPLSMLTCAAFIVTLPMIWWDAIRDECGPNYDRPSSYNQTLMDGECWLGKANTLINIGVVYAFPCLCICTIGFLAAPLKAAKDRIVNRIRKFDVTKCVATNPDDIQLVHQYIHEMFPAPDIHASLQIFQQKMRHEVAQAAAYKLNEQVAINTGVMLIMVLTAIPAVWLAMLNTMGTFKPMSMSDLMLDWAWRRLDGAPNPEAIHYLALAFSILIFCVILPACTFFNMKRQEDQHHKQSSAAVAPAPPQQATTQMAQPAVQRQPVAVAMPPQQQMMQVMVPPGTGPGATVVVATPTGQLQVVVPAGVSAGQTFNVALPA